MTEVKDTNTFTPAELYLLLAPFEAENVFGLPGKKRYALRGEAVFEQGFKRLKAKGILSDAGELTDGGGFLIDSLAMYYQSKQYIRLNQFLFAISEKNEDELFVLIEVKPHAEFRFERINKIQALDLIRQVFPLVMREPLDDETCFFKEQLTNEKRHEAEQFDPGTDFISMEFFHIDQEPQEASNPLFYKQYLAFELNKWLIMLDVVNDVYYRGSQYVFLKLLFDELKFPYKERM